MKKRVFIIHGWGGYPKEGWFPWLKKELVSKDFITSIPAMPDTENPRIKTWVSHLAKVVGEPNEYTYFVGHSIGCQTILRYLESLKNKKVGGAVFVAGWLYLENLEDNEKSVAKPWLETPIDFNKVKTATDKFVVIISDNEPYNAIDKNKKTFKEKLGAEIIMEHGKGHFSGGDKVTKLPSVLKSILKMAK